MTITPAEVISVEAVSLADQITKGLVPTQVAFIKETSIEINEELTTAGQCLRAVAAHLFEIKRNVKTGNWKAFLSSGVINCSPRFATDLVNAHENWLGTSDIEDSMLAGLTARSLNAMGGKGVTDKDRSKVFRKIADGEVMTEASVRRILKGAPGHTRSSLPKTIDERIARLNDRLKQLMMANEELKLENKKLRGLVAKGSKS